MIIGLALIGFIYGLWFGGRYAEVMGGTSTDWHSDQWLDGRLQEELRVGFQNIPRAFSKTSYGAYCPGILMVCGCTVRL